MMYLIRSIGTVFVLAILIAGTTRAATTSSVDLKIPANNKLNQKCAQCHLKENKSLVLQWENSPHALARNGQVGCYNCHAAEKGDELGYLHEGAFIKAILTPRDCRHCHEPQTGQMALSRHATAGEIAGSLDYMLAEVVCGMPSNKADLNGSCRQCHGSVVRIKRDKNNQVLRDDTGAPLLDHNTWPNTGIGRINPDGSKGSCIACHSKHSFRASVARQPETCGRCHLGPDHPQKEIYEESKHGIAFFTAQAGDGRNAMNILKVGQWVLGEDYYTAPTCATCHMGSFVNPDGTTTPASHNVGDRISWNLRAPLSSKLNRVTFADGSVTDITGETPPRAGQKAIYRTYVRDGDQLKRIVTEKTIQEVLGWNQRRANMQAVCKSCHSFGQTRGFYNQFDDLVNLYNDKFAGPGLKIINMLKKDGIWQNSGFQYAVGFTWFEIWHHEGRRARMGAAMFAPDYTHWNGMYEIARNFYPKFLPGVQKLADRAGKGAKYRKLIDELLAKPEHRWFMTGGSGETMKLIEEEQKLRYNQ